MKAEVGYRFPECSFHVDRTRVEEFLRAIEVEPALGYAGQAGFPVPPGFLMYVTTYGAIPIYDALDVDVERALFGGTRLEVFEPVCVGATITVRPWVSNFFTKPGANGSLTFAELACDYVGEDEVLLAREHTTIIERESVS